MRQYIGIDLGGTNIKGALVSETGEILKQRSAPTRAEAGPEAVAKAIAAMICQLAEGDVFNGVDYYFSKSPFVDDSFRVSKATLALNSGVNYLCVVFPISL